MSPVFRVGTITGYHSSCQVWMMLEGPFPIIVPALALRLRSGDRYKTQPLP